MLPNREGRFRSNILEHGVAETGENELATCTVKFALTEEFTPDGWAGLGPEDAGMEITGYFYLERRDGAINTVAVDQLKAALGWDGRDPMWLQDADLSATVVQVRLEYEEYRGQQKIKVKWLDAADAEGMGVQKANDQQRKAITTKLGSKLRALAGGAPAPAPKPTGKPTPPPPTKAPAKTPPPSAAGTIHTKDSTWQFFCTSNPQLDEQQQADSFYRLLDHAFPDRDADTLTAVEWGKVYKAIEDDIPF